jgi:predicted GIY-YIG superfamily endonuclease
MPWIPFPRRAGRWHRRLVPCVYLLRCSDRSIYVGWTSDLTTRLAQHQAGKASKHTAARRPVVLIFQEQHVTSESAIARERQIKRWSRRKKEALADGNLELLKQL